jgi:hypothetical protein
MFQTRINITKIYIIIFLMIYLSFLYIKKFFCYP